MIVVISHHTPIDDEFQILHQLFDTGLESFQLHKPGFSVEDTEAYLNEVDENHRHKVTFHAEQLKFHSLEEIAAYAAEFSYAFLSPVFDSISKKGYKSPFDLDVLKAFLANRREKIIALGGVDENKIATVKALGFSGIALLGAIWESDNPVEKFNRISAQWKQ